MNIKETIEAVRRAQWRADARHDASLELVDYEDTALLRDLADALERGQVVAWKHWPKVLILPLDSDTPK